MSILVHNNKKELIEDSKSKTIYNNNKNNFNSNIEPKLKHTNNKSKTTTTDNQTNLSLQHLDFSFENRLAQIIGLLSKGYTQQEIAQQIGVHQSTISRDSKYLKQEAKRQIWEHFDKDILFEYYRYLGGNNEISKKLWEIVQDVKTSTKEKTNALSLLNQLSLKRLEILMNGPESLKNVKKNIAEIKDIDKIENDSLLKLLSKLEKNNI
jgi:Trp operon repressor